MVKHLAWDIKWAAFFAVLIVLSVVLPQNISYWLLIRNLSGETTSKGLGYFFEIFPVIGSVLFVAFIVMRLKSLSFHESVRFLGFKKLDLKQLFVGFILSAPMAGSVYLAYAICLRENIPIVFYPDWPLQLFLTFFIAGIGEEVIFRGFFFQCLRRGRSFYSAAALSGLFWSFSHLNLLSTSTNPWGILVVIVNVFLLAFPSAYVFERCGNVIWPWLLVHVSFNMLYIIVDFKDGDIRTDFVIGLFYAGYFLSLIITFPVTALFFPGKKIDILVEKKLEVKINQENETSPKLILYLLFFLIASISVSFLTVSVMKSKMDAPFSKYRKEILADPMSVSAYHELAKALDRYGKYEEAIEKLKKAVEINPKNPSIYVTWGAILEHSEKYEESIPMFQKAVELEPGFGLAYSNWGGALYYLKKYNQAILKCRMAIKLDPKNIYAYYWYARALQQLGQYDEAIKNYEKIKGLSTDLFAKEEAEKEISKIKEIYKSSKRP